MKRGFLNERKSHRVPAVLPSSASHHNLDTVSSRTSATHDTPNGGMKRGFLNSVKGAGVLRKDVELLPEREPIEPVLIDIDPSKQVAKRPGVCFEDTIPTGQSRLKCSFIVQPERPIRVNGKLQPRLRIVLVSRNATLPDTRNVFCSQPYPNTNILEEFPDGWSECFIREDIKKRMLSVPGFPRRIQRPVSRAYRIGDSPGKGKGMFATRMIREGELVLDERPLMVLSSVPPLCPYTYSASDSNTMTDDYAQLFRESVLGIAYSRMPLQNRRAFDELYNSHEHDDAGRVAGIVRTCGYAITGYIGPKSNYVNTMSMMVDVCSGICKDGSRINHSCCPSLRNSWCTESFSFRFYAVRDIREGEELTTNYKGCHNSYAERTASLDRYGFKCTCPHCLDPMVSDKTREVLKGCAEFAMALAVEGLDLGSHINTIVAAESKKAGQGLQASPYYVALLFGLVAWYVAKGHDAKAAFYGRKLYLARRGDSTRMDFCETLSKLKAHTGKYWGVGKVETGLWEQDLRSIKRD